MGMASVAGWPGFESWIRYMILRNAFSLPVSRYFSSENGAYNPNNSTDITGLLEGYEIIFVKYTKYFLCTQGTVNTFPLYFLMCQGLIVDITFKPLSSSSSSGNVG